MRPNPKQTTPLLFIPVILFSLFIMAKTTWGAETIIINADEQFKFATHYFDTGDYGNAASEFKKFVYFFPDDPRVAKANFLTGSAFFFADQFEPAIEVFSKLQMPYSDSLLVNQSFFMLSRCHLKLNQAQLAIAVLKNLIAISDNSSVKDRAFYELSWIYIKLGMWDTAQQDLTRISPYGKSRLNATGLEEGLLQAKHLKYKNPSLAGVMSGIIPGSGQLYIGRKKDALTSFLINAGLIIASVTAFKDDNPALGGVIAFVGFGFYSGNIYGAASGAKKFNRNLKREFAGHLERSFRVGLIPPDSQKGAAVMFQFAF